MRSYRDDTVRPIDIMDVIGMMPDEDEVPTIQVKEEKKPKQKARKEKAEPKQRYKMSVSQYTREGIFLRRFDCMKDAAEETGIDGKLIARASRGDNKTAGGYVWKRNI